MEIEKLIYTNEIGESLELSTDSIYHCNVSKDVSGVSGVQSIIYSTNSMGQHGDSYVGQRIEARDVDVIGHINTVATHLSCPKINQIDCHRMSRYNGISLKKGKVPGHLQFRHR